MCLELNATEVRERDDEGGLLVAVERRFVWPNEGKADARRSGGILRGFDDAGFFGGGRRDGRRLRVAEETGPRVVRRIVKVAKETARCGEEGKVWEAFEKMACSATDYEKRLGEGGEEMAEKGMAGLCWFQRAQAVLTLAF